MPFLLTLLQLCRLPAVFTAMADIFAGFLLTHPHWTPPTSFMLLLGASAGLYLAGMVFNDLFDVAQDRLERPQRPIPSGRISVGGAMIFGMLLFLAGLACAATVGQVSLQAALLLTGAILAYDGVLKRTVLGPVAMGSCRFLNLLLGASAGSSGLNDLFQSPQLWVASAMGIYVVGVTWFARSEARQSQRGQLLGSMIVVNSGLLVLAAWILFRHRHQPFEILLPLLCWLVIGWLINSNCRRACAEPEPAFVQKSVGFMLMAIILLNALTIFTWKGLAGLPYVVATLALIPPAKLLRKRISMT